MGFVINETEWPARRCSGESCRQGDAECKTPEACQLPEPADRLLKNYVTSMLTALLAVACVLVFVVLSL